jgi:DNA adenine methylase
MSERLVHFTPLRYPGGKGKLANFVKKLVELNDLVDCEYVEPYAGGAAIGLELLFHEYARRIHINDISRPIHAFWKSVLEHTDDLCRLVRDTRLSVASWDQQKRILKKQDDQDDLTLGFATFFLNRTNRSGILNAGIIGGRDQTGEWKIDARYNAEELIRRIEAIARLGQRISLSRLDAKTFLGQCIKMASKTLIYLDPPYYAKGKDLYYDYYTDEDHEAIAKLVQTKIRRQKWIVSYDNVKRIRELYRGCPSIVYALGYSARDIREGREIMFFSKGLQAPPAMGVMRHIRRTA